MPCLLHSRWIDLVLAGDVDNSWCMRKCDPWKTEEKGVWGVELLVVVEAWEGGIDG